MTGRKKFKTEIKQVLKLLEPPPKITVAEWANQNRFLARGVSAESGKWNTDRLPYQREPMEEITGQSNEIILMWAAQLGKTEVLLNTIGYFIHAEPAPQLVVYPTLDTARKFSTKKLAPMISETSVLADKVKDPRTRDSGNTILSKEYSGGSLVIAGSNSPSSLRQISCRIVVQDEIDSWEPSCGEGDPSALADARASNFHDAVLVKASTPTIQGASRIEAAYEKSDQRKFYVPCHKCGASHVLQWQSVKWEENKPETAYYECPECQCRWTDQQRVQAIKKGEWRAENPEARTRGYWLSGLYRIMGRKKGYANFLHEFVAGFLDAKHKGRFALMAWTNNFLAETWQEAGERLESEEMLKRCEEYPDKHLPEGVLAITVGADVQKDRIEATAFGWGIAEQCWAIEHRTFWGSPEQAQVWTDLDDFLNKKWRSSTGQTMRINCALIDSGFLTRNCYAFTKPRQARRVFACKGSARNGAPLATKRVVKMGRTVVMFVGTDTAKDSLFSRLRLEEEGPRYIHFPHGNGFDEQYFLQLTAEEIRTRMHHGFPIRYYRKLRERNEALDCAVYAMAALDVLNPNFERLAENMAKAEQEPEEEPDNPMPKSAKETPPAPRRRPPGGGFVNNWQF